MRAYPGAPGEVHKYVIAIEHFDTLLLSIGAEHFGVFFLDCCGHAGW